MKTTKLILLLFAAVFAASCSHNDPIEENSIYGSRQRIVAEPNQLLEMASFQNVLNVMGTLYPQRRIQLDNNDIDTYISYYTGNILHSITPSIPATENDTLLTIFNFGNDNGFAVYSDAYGVMAVTDTGHVDISNANFPISLEWITLPDINYDILRLVNTYALYSHSYFSWLENNSNSSNNGTFHPYKVEDIIIQPETAIAEYSCFVPVKFHQQYPYDNYCTVGLRFSWQNYPDSVAQRFLAGCGPIAVAQVFSYHHEPTKIGTVEGDWDEIILDCNAYPYTHTYTNSIDILAQWIRHLGQTSGALYVSSMTGVPITENLANCFRNYDYYGAVKTYKEKYRNCYDFEQLMRNQQPTVIRATDHDSSVVNGHYWVVDGFCRLEKQYERIQYWINESLNLITHDDPVFYTEQRELVHCNFGWGGYCNGYYVIGDFNLQDGPDEDWYLEDERRYLTDSDASHYCDNIEAIIYWR